MGCNCKNKQEEKKPSAPQIQVEQVQAGSTPSMEQIITFETYLPEINSNPEKRIYIQKFVSDYMGENIINYCDQVCQTRLRDKLNKIKQTTIQQ